MTIRGSVLFVPRGGCMLLLWRNRFGEKLVIDGGYAADLDRHEQALVTGIADAHLH